MKILFPTLLFLLLFAYISQAQAGEKNARRDTFLVHVFLLEDCVISQNYTAELRRLHELYACGRIQFIGVFPNRFSSKQKIAAFGKKYRLPFELKRDYYQTRTKKMGVKVTPEVAVYNVSRNEIFYRGRIDDTYVSIGKRRPAKQTAELEDALKAILENREAPVKETQAVGCFIQFVEK